MAITISHKLGLALLVHTRAFSWTCALAESSSSYSRDFRGGGKHKKKRDPHFEGPPRSTSTPRDHSDNRPPQSYPPRPATRPPPTPPQFVAHRETIKRRFPNGWSPPRTISREAMDTLRAMHARDPVQFRTPVLATKFKISPEAVSRILKSKWTPSPETKSKMIARENKAKDMWIAEKMRTERAQAERSFEGRLNLADTKGNDNKT